MIATRLGALAFVFASCAGLAASSHAQTPAKTEVSKTTRGPFAVGNPPRNVTVEITTTSAMEPDGTWAAIDSFVVRDLRGEVLLRHADPMTMEAERYKDRSVVPAVVRLPGGGAALLVMSEASQSAPGTGVDGQFFGFTGEGRFVPMTGIIVPHLDETDASAFKVTRFGADGSSRLVVEVEEWADYFNVIRHYPIHPEGAPSDDAVALEEKRYRVRIDAKEAARERENSELDPIVTLRSAPTWDAPGQRCVLEESSTIEFLDAARAGGWWWVRVRIDGREGYVTNDGGERELECLGLPSAG